MSNITEVWVVVEHTWDGDDLLGVCSSADTVRARFPLPITWDSRDEHKGRLYGGAPGDPWNHAYEATRCTVLDA